MSEQIAAFTVFVFLLFCTALNLWVVCKTVRDMVKDHRETKARYREQYLKYCTHYPEQEHAFASLYGIKDKDRVDLSDSEAARRFKYPLLYAIIDAAGLEEEHAATAGKPGECHRLICREGDHNHDR